VARAPGSGVVKGPLSVATPRPWLYDLQLNGTPMHALVIFSDNAQTKCDELIVFKPSTNVDHEVHKMRERMRKRLPSGA